MMLNLEAEIDHLVRERERIGYLLLHKKMQKDVEATDLAFITMKNIAKLHWCPRKALLQSKRRETKIFSWYLRDRLFCAAKLDLIDELPVDNQVLAIGTDLKLQDVETLLSKETSSQNEAETVLPFLTLQTKQGRNARVLNPRLSVKEKEKYRKDAHTQDIPVIDIQYFSPLSRDKILKQFLADKLPAFRWSFNWDNYVVIGEPDGLTEDYVYVFDIVPDESVFRYQKPVASTLGDLYGYFFNRDRKKVELYIRKTQELKTLEKQIDKNMLKETLEKFKVNDKDKPSKTHLKWKCKSCTYRVECPM